MCKTNINGAMNLIDACTDKKLKKLWLFLQIKLVIQLIYMELLNWLQINYLLLGSSHLSVNKTLFSVVRYGNVMGSRGSVIPFFLMKKKEGLVIPITDTKMTRFMITLDEGC